MTETLAVGHAQQAGSFGERTFACNGLNSLTNNQ